MPNARSLENLKKNPFPRLGNKALASRPLCVKVSPEIEQAVRKFPKTSSWLREAIVEKLEREKGALKATRIENPLIREAIASSIANKRAELAAEKRRSTKADQFLIEKWEKEIEQLEELLGN